MTIDISDIQPVRMHKFNKTGRIYKRIRVGFGINRAIAASPVHGKKGQRRFFQLDTFQLKVIDGPIRLMSAQQPVVNPINIRVSTTWFALASRQLFEAAEIRLSVEYGTRLRARPRGG